MMSRIPKQWDVVISAERYADKLGLVYQIGPSQLYLFHLDGSGALKLTSGPFSRTDPILSSDGRTLRFQEAKEKYNGHGNYKPFDCTLSSTGDVVRMQLHRDDRAGWNGDDDRVGPKSRYLERTKEGDAKIKPSIGPAFEFWGTPQYSSDRKFALVTDYEHGTGIVNLKTGRAARLPANIQAVAWMDSNTIFGCRDTSPKSEKFEPKVTCDLILFNTDGTIRKKVSTGFNRTEAYDDLLSDMGRVKHLWPTSDPNVILIEQHHAMSDGGYDYSTKVNLKSGKIEPGVDGTIYAVSPDRTKLIAGVRAWVGGYKNPGSVKLERLAIWDTRIWESQEVGFRRMLCYGACFVPRKY